MFCHVVVLSSAHVGVGVVVIAFGIVSPNKILCCINTLTIIIIIAAAPCVNVFFSPSGATYTAVGVLNIAAPCVSVLCCVFQSMWNHRYSCRCTEHSSTLCHCVVLCFSVHVEPPLLL